MFLLYANIFNKIRDLLAYAEIRKLENQNSLAQRENAVLRKRLLLLEKLCKTLKGDVTSLATRLDSIENKV